MENVYNDMYSPVRAIVHQHTDKMAQHLNLYSNPDTRFEVTTWSGRCRLTPLALAVEVPGYNFRSVVTVLVQNAHIGPSAPYMHLLVRWGPYNAETCRNEVQKESDSCWCGRLFCRAGRAPLADRV